jgi:hypothetical protein
MAKGSTGKTITIPMSKIIGNASAGKPQGQPAGNPGTVGVFEKLQDTIQKAPPSNQGEKK